MQILIERGVSDGRAQAAFEEDSSQALYSNEMEC